MDKFNIRLVAKGFNQKEGIDFFDIFSPITHIISIRMLVAIASIYKLEIHQIDIKIAFSNGDLREEIYMYQLEGFIIPSQKDKVCKFIKLFLD